MMKVLISSFLLLVATAVISQVSLVPAEHQVYEWLHLQRVKGNLTNYSYETLPLTRKQILDQLYELEKKSSELNRIDQRLLSWYIQEFSPDQLKKDKSNTYLQGWEDDIKSSVKKKWDLLKSSQEPHLHVFHNDTFFWATDFLFLGGTINAQDPGTGFDEASNLTYSAIRSYGTLYGMFGGHVEIYNPKNYVNGMFRYHPEWGQTLDGSRASKNTTLYAQAYATFQYKALGVHIGNGNLKYGVKGSEAQILRQDAGNFDWVRVNLDTRYLQYTFMHGALKSPTVTVDVDGFPGVQSRISPDRWFALRRIQLTPAKWISLAFTESLVYSNRPVELAYANPLLPLRFGEYETLDKDNPIWFFDGTLRPVKNLELYATIGIDDLLKYSDIFKPTGKRSSEDAVISYQAGLHYSLPTSTILNAEVLQFDPYFYTHWQLFNTYDENGSPLGASIGPNARQIYFSARQWLPWRSFIDISIANVKKGLNVVDSVGNLVTDVGGDLFEGQLNTTEVVRLFSGDIHKWNQLRLDIGVEPIRGIRFFGSMSRRMMIQGDQLKDLNSLYGGIEINFYPGTPFVLSKIPGINILFSQ